MRLLSIIEVSKLIHCKPQTIKNRLSLGLPLPPSFRLGGKRLWKEVEVHNWIDSLPRTGEVSAVSPSAVSEIADQPASRRGRPRNEKRRMA